jgi:hypothetical protein
MHLTENYAVFPEGDIQEISGRLRLGELVDLNGRPFSGRLAGVRTIAFRVARIRTREERGASATYHDLELVSAAELEAYAGR